MTDRTTSSRLSLGSLIVRTGVGTGLLAVIIGGFMFILPRYGVYVAEQEGKAILARADYSKQAQVRDAEAKLDSAKYLKQAADQIESSLSPQYLRYLEIQMQEEVGGKNDRAVYFIGGQGSASPVISVPAGKTEN